MQGIINIFDFSKARNRIIGTGMSTALRAVAHLLNVPKPTVTVGKDASLKLCDSLGEFGLQKILIVTDPGLKNIGIIDPLVERLEKQGVQTVVFADVEPDPTFKVVERALVMLRKHNCDSVLAVGGGSSIDAAKVVALAASNDADPRSLVGVLKARKPTLPLFVIPTTAGTGSEATIGAVISDTDTHQKQLIVDTKVIPMAAALDPVLMKGLPAAITAATGMDALTHCIEAYLSKAATQESDYYARAGIRMIFKNLPVAVKKGSNLAARESMALASYYGGLAINAAGVGYVHGIAHQLGARYHIPHGEANAKVLPHVLEFNKHVASQRLADIADLLGLGDAQDSDVHKAEMLIHAIRKMIADLAIEPKIQGMDERDFPQMIAAAFKEVNSTYPVPDYMSYREAESVFKALA